MSWTRVKALAVFLTLAGATHAADVAADVAAAGRGPIRVAYVTPQDEAHEPIYRTLRERRVLERIRNRLAKWRLPRRLTIRTQGCDGEINAWYDPSNTTVSICYEYLAFIQHHARNIPPAAAAEGLTPENFVAGAFLDVTLHELAHAVFDLKRVPILGREEDAADQVAAYVLLEYWGQDSRQMIASAAVIHAAWAREVPLELRHFADEHGLPAQRFFNLMCMAYGKDPKRFGDLVPKGFLTVARLIVPTLRGRPTQVAGGKR
jgi:hypothetical protein